jgi:hypothetical protein
MDETTYKYLFKEIKKNSQKIANQIFLSRIKLISDELEEYGINIEAEKAVKKGRPKVYLKALKN